MQKCTLCTCVQQFLFKAMHSMQKVGKYWQHIPNNKYYELCITCGIIVSMDHILIHCWATPRQIIWQLTEALWPHAHIPWPKITLSTLLGSGTIAPPDNNPQKDQGDRNSRTQIARARGACRLLQILLSKGTHLIWVLRCERVIKDTNHWHPEEIHTHWLRAINLHLTKDKLYATKIKCNKDTYQLVRNTWQPVLQQIRNLPNNWVHHSEVLVG